METREKQHVEVGKVGRKKGKNDKDKCI